jgi:hypothetical protein
MAEKEEVKTNLVSATLGQPAVIDGKIKPAGEIVLVPEHMKAALEYVPPKEVVETDKTPAESKPAKPAEPPKTV